VEEEGPHALEMAKETQEENEEEGQAQGRRAVGLSPPIFF
jgi:hypothetical protein